MNQKTSQRKTVYDGEIHKCPNCGEILSVFDDICPSCGYDFRGDRANSPVKEFAARLADTQDDAHKIILIQNYPIPNNKEDILEFINLAAACFNANEDLTGNSVKKDLSDAWLTKITQSYQKSRLLFANDAEFVIIQKVYDQIHNRVKASTDAAKKKKTVQLLLITIGAGGGLIVFMIGFIIYLSSPL